MPNKAKRVRTRVMVALVVGVSVAAVSVITAAALSFLKANGTIGLIGVGVGVIGVAVVIVGGANLVIGITSSGLRTTREATSGAGRALRLSRIVTAVGRLLPADVRDEYREEWAAWMLDLRADGTRRIRRGIELFTIMLTAPRLAVTLRLAARRAVDL